jgi:PAT family beta-lactamase induction signal transducer AmpG
MAADNFGIAFAGVALVTYMSSLTSLGYTATQYALLSSAYTYVGKFSKGFSGVIVDHLAARTSLLEAYALFFVGAGLLGLPALLLCVVLARRTVVARPSSR